MLFVCLYVMRMLVVQPAALHYGQVLDTPSKPVTVRQLQLIHSKS